jgi:multiple sugar transport system permease protein
VMSSCFAGYAFSRFQVRESKAIFLVVLSTLMIPAMVTIMPLYMIMAKFQMTNQRGLWFVWGLAGIPFNIFHFRQFFSTIPTSFEESARMDGAGRLQIFFSIMFPLVQTGLIVASIFAFQWTWQDFLMPVLFLSDEKITLAVKVAMSYADQKENVLYNIGMAGIVYYTLPLVIVYFALQKRFVAGLLSGGLKG